MEQTAPRRANIENHVRDPEDGAFELREIGSARAFVQLRPQRVPPGSFEVSEVTSRVAGGQPGFILKNTSTDRFLFLSEPERFLWDQMDGATSLQQMATAYVLRYGEFNFDIIPKLIRKLQRAGLLTLTPASRLRKVLARNQRRWIAVWLETVLTTLERVNISSRRVQPLFVRMYRWGGFVLFTRLAAALCVILAIVGIVSGVKLWNDAGDIAHGLGARPILALLSVKLLFIFTLAWHQIVHGLALIHYGRRVREFGFTFLHGFVPTFYVDVTDIFMTSRRARVVTAVSGATVHLVLGSVWFIVAVHAPTGFLQAFAAASGMIQWQAFVVALYPFCFIEMDGYHVLVDALGVPTLKHDAAAYVRAVLRGKVRARFSGEEGLWLGYAGLSAVSVAAFVAFNIWLVVHALT